jgi:hypothetical protein
MSKISAIFMRIGCTAIPAIAFAQPNFRALNPLRAERPITASRWPDSTTCHFPDRPAVDQATGQSSGRRLKPYTQVARPRLAPASDGRCYYGNGSIADVEDTNGQATGRRNNLPPGALQTARSSARPKAIAPDAASPSCLRRDRRVSISAP